MFSSALRHVVRSGRINQPARKVSTTFLTAAKKETIKKNWLSDPSVYPLMVVFGCAMTWVIGVGSSCLLYNPDVQINPKKRNTKIRDWNTHEK